MSQQVGTQSPLSVIYLVHIALEIPLAIQGLWSPISLPFLELNNTALVILKLYASLSLASCIAAILCFGLPEFLPGKRAVAISLTVYHSIVSTVLLQSPRFIPISFGPFFEAYKVIPETVWGSIHGLVGLGFVFWWQSTVSQAAVMRGAVKQQ